MKQQAATDSVLQRDMQLVRQPVQSKLTLRYESCASTSSMLKEIRSYKTTPFGVD